MVLGVVIVVVPRRLSFSMSLSWLVTLCHQVYTSKWACDMNLFYSLGDSNVFLTLQTYYRSADALGGCLAGIAGTYLFTLDPVAPFAFAAFIASALACEGNICSSFGVFHANCCQVIVSIHLRKVTFFHHHGRVLCTLIPETSPHRFIF